MKENTLQKLTITLLSVLLIISMVFVGLTFSQGEVLSPQLAFAENTNRTTWGGVDIKNLYEYDNKNLDLKGLMSVNIDKSKLSKGSPVRIAVIDTGLVDVDKTDNKDLKELYSGLIPLYENDWLAYNSVTDKFGKSQVMDEENLSENPLHGTSVTTIIAMQIKALGLQDYIKIIPIKANTSGRNSFTRNSIINALEKAVDPKGNIKANVINLSLGSYTSDWRDKAFQEVLNKVSQEAIIVTAAGNEGKLLDPEAKENSPFYPAACENVISVMASNSENQVMKKPSGKLGSNIGYYDVIAPGENIYTYTAHKDKEKDKNILNWGTVSGTSMASPLVAAFTAIYTARLRTLFQDPTKFPTPNIIAQTIVSSLTKIPSKTVENLDIEISGQYKTPNGKFVDAKKTYTLSKINYVGLLQKTNYEDGFEYAPPTGIEIEVIPPKGLTISGIDYSDGAKWYSGLYMKDLVFDISAKLTPIDKVHPSFANRIQWYVQYGDGQGEKILGYGSKMNFRPEYGGEGTYLTISYTNESGEVFSKAIRFDLKYQDLALNKCKIAPIESIDQNFENVDENISVKQYDTITLGITGLQYVDTRKLEIIWYVNNRVAGHGLTYDYKASKSGVDNIIVSIKDNSKGDGARFEDIPYTTKLHVVSFAKEPLAIASFTIITLIVIASIITIIVIAVRNKKSKKLR